MEVLSVPLAQPLKIQAYNILKKAIACGILKDNEMITERRAQEEFHISRTPFREAVQSLIAEGWVLSIPYRGICVNPITAKMIKNVFDMRLILETAIIKQISHTLNETALKALEGVVSEMKENPEEQSHYDFAVLDYDFHHKLYELTDNQLMISFYEQIADWFIRIAMRIVPVNTRRKEVIQEHREIIEALRNGTAEKKLTDHFFATTTHAIKCLGI